MTHTYASEHRYSHDGDDDDDVYYRSLSHDKYLYVCT